MIISTVIKSKALNWPIVFAGASGALAVFLAADAAHGLKDEPAALATIASSFWLPVAGYGLALGSPLFCSGLNFAVVHGHGALRLGGAPRRPAFHGLRLALGIHGWRHGKPKSS